MGSLEKTNRDLVRALRLNLAIVKDARKTLIFSEASRAKKGTGELIHGEYFDPATIPDQVDREELEQLDKAIAAAEAALPRRPL